MSYIKAQIRSGRSFRIWGISIKSTHDLSATTTRVIFTNSRKENDFDTRRFKFTKYQTDEAIGRQYQATVDISVPGMLAITSETDETVSVASVREFHGVLNELSR
jgi:hypothetical protein